MYADATVEILCDEDCNMKGLFFQDPSMKQSFQAYPEIVFLDATYKLLQIGTPTYLMLVEDSNGMSEVVFVCLLVSEDENSISWMIDTFKRLNSNWIKTTVVMADKDIRERHVIKNLLPSASVLICLFHALRTFRREISCDKLGITAGQRTFSLELIQKMAYASSNEEYQELFDDLQCSAPENVKEYFNKNWAPIKDEWVLHHKAMSGSFLNSTNNRLESLNAKLKQVIDHHSSLEDFVNKFFVVLKSLQIERDHKAALVFQKTKVQLYDGESPENKYSQLLTPYAAQYVIKQLQLVPKVDDNFVCEGSNKYTVNSSEGSRVVSLHDCTCLFRKSMKLPCRHMLALRISLQKPLYDPTLCETRWTSDYYNHHQRIFSNLDSVAVHNISHIPQKSTSVLSTQQKYKKAALITTELASITSESSGILFDRRIELLQELISSWKEGKEISLMEIDSGLQVNLVLNNLGLYQIFVDTANTK